MKILEVEQGSSSWHALRKGRIGASDAPIIAGVSPFVRPQALFRQKVLGEDVWESPAMKRGKLLEPIARDMYEKVNGRIYDPIVAVDDEFDWMLASLDGYCDGVILEIKCPSDKTFNEIVFEGNVPVYYKYQINHQMRVVGSSRAVLIVFNGFYYHELPLERDEAVIAEILAKEQHFYECMKRGVYE